MMNFRMLGSKVAGVTLLLGLGGCFQPMYAPASGKNVQGELQAISIAAIPGLTGHYLENELRFLLNGTGTEVTPRYVLQVNIAERTQTPLINTVTGQATSNSVSTTADYKLVPMGGKDPVIQGTVVSLASYDRNTQRFANIRAARDAEIRNAKSLAQDIRTRIAAEIATRP